MEDIRKERLLISIITLAGLSCIAENLIAGWESWMLPLILIGAAMIWWIHISQKALPTARISFYFLYASILAIYFGIHEISFFENSLVALLFIVAFTIMDNEAFLSVILIEYFVIMAFQFYMMFKNEQIGEIDSRERMRIVFHFITVITVYVFSRVSINRRIKNNTKIEEWRATVNENEKDVEDFLSNISHELRTPVNVINGMTTILQKDDDRKELSNIKSAGIRLSHQIEDIQDYTELKRGELVLEEENYMCISLINDVVANFTANDKKNDLELIVDLDPNTPNMLKGDVKKLHKLFRHLLDNAVKFTRKGGIYIKVFSVPQEYGVNLIIEIQDTGIGMTRADMALVSKGMYQANKKRNRSTGGIGIGLPIVYGFVHKMGGFVKISSKKGRGTKVRLSIPQKIIDNEHCLSLKESVNGIVFYIKQEKYKVPEIRDYYRSMAVNLATGLNTKLYSAGEKRELDHLINDLKISYIFTGQEEYEMERSMMDYLSSKGYRIIVASDPGFEATEGSGVLVVQKPLYGLPVVRILNGEENFNKVSDGKVRFTGVSALVVDDEPMNLVVASGLLREYKMYADTAESGREAIEKYEKGDYDVIFMDHMMPEMDGVEAMKRIRHVADSSFRHPVIIALTANALSGAREMFMNEGFDGFIAKPIDISEFERVMKKVLPEEMIHYEGRDER